MQLESFFDPNLVKGISFSENPLPYFEQLVAEYPSGYLSVPCFGAGTANTEFEVQTGMNMDDFGPGEYPYKTVLQSKVCESMAYDLKEKGMPPMHCMTMTERFMTDIRSSLIWDMKILHQLNIWTISK